MRTGSSQRRFRNDTAATLMTLPEALATILEHAEPVESVEVSLTEAVGLVLAEPTFADVDLPPFDRASASGYAVRALEAVPGTLLRVAAPWIDADGERHEIESGEASRVEAGEALPVGADAVLADDAVRNDSGESPACVIEVRRGAEPGQSVIRRGATLAAGSILAGAGTRITPAMVALLAAQGCVHPICHRRVRVSIVAVGEHLVSPADAPILHHERNAGNLAVAALLVGAGAMVHDLGALPESEFAVALDRAVNSPIVLILGRITGEICRALARAGVEPTVSGVALEPLGGLDVGHGVARDDDGRVVAHVIHLPLDPTTAVAVATLVVLPLVARLQGADPTGPATLRATWDSHQSSTSDRLRAVPATLAAGADGRLHARPVVAFGPTDLPDLALADGLALFPPDAGPWHGGEVIDFAPFATWPGRTEV